MKQIKKAHMLPLLYVAKRFEKRAKAFVEEMKQELLGSGENIISDKSGLQVKFVDVKGRKSFSPEKAATTLSQVMGKKEFEAHFSSYEIEKIPGKTPPPELLKELNKYFKIKKAITVTEGGAKMVPHGLSDEAFEEGCYERGDGSTRMDLPTKISDKELIDKLTQLDIEAVESILLEG